MIRSFTSFVCGRLGEAIRIRGRSLSGSSGRPAKSSCSATSTETAAERKLSRLPPRRPICALVTQEFSGAHVDDQHRRVVAPGTVVPAVERRVLDTLTVAEGLLVDERVRDRADLRMHPVLHLQLHEMLRSVARVSVLPHARGVENGTSPGSRNGVC